MDELAVPLTLSLRDRAESVVQFVRRFGIQRERLFQELRTMPTFVDLARSLGSSSRYVIEWPTEALAAQRAGTAVWQTAADGTLPVVIRLKNGEIVKHLRLREVADAGQGLSTLNNLAVQASLAQVVGKLEELDAKLDRVLAGARADRLGQVLAGEQLYAQALAARDPGTRRATLHSAHASLATGRGQLLSNVAEQARALKVPTGSALLFRKNPSRELEERIDAMQEDVKAVALATRSMALVTEELGETGMTAVALSQFASKLSEPVRCLRQLSRYVPFRGGIDPAGVWGVLDDHVLPKARMAAEAMVVPARPLLTEFEPNDLLAVGTR